MNRHSLATIAQWLGQTVDQPHRIRLFQQDSRLVEPGDLFFAIRGEKVDGHTFLQEVAQQGACAAVVAADYCGDSYGMVLLVVDDVIAALHRMAKIVFACRRAKVIAVTGSVGKTTTKEFIATLLSKKFSVAKTPGSVNSQVGLPLFILNHISDEEIAVIEMGMSAAGEITKLIDIAPPDIVLVTKIALAHAAFFPRGMPEIAQAKAEIFSCPQIELGLINVQAGQFEAIRTAGQCRKVIFGLESEAGEKDYMLCTRGEQFQIIEKGEPSPCFRLPFQVTHLCENFLGSAAVARHLGLSWEEICEQAAHLKTYKNRFEIVEREGITFLNDS